MGAAMSTRKGAAANPAPPTVCRVRLRFAKRGRLRFASHRDVARAFERAVRRAGVPVAHSHGFNPHPRLSWVGAAPTGTASEAEYVEIGLTAPVDPAALAGALDAALPDGLDVLASVTAEPGTPALADLIDASRWRIELPEWRRRTWLPRWTCFWPPARWWCSGSPRTGRGRWTRARRWSAQG